MENSFGHDFSRVRIHQGSHVSALGALAYTQGENIHFAHGIYDPRSARGAHILGHELAHVVQQRQGRVRATGKVRGVPLNDSGALEREADRMGAMAVRGERAAGTGGSGARGTSGPDAPPIQMVKVYDTSAKKLISVDRHIRRKGTQYYKSSHGHFRGSGVTKKINGKHYERVEGYASRAASTITKKTPAPSVPVVAPSTVTSSAPVTTPVVPPPSVTPPSSGGFAFAPPTSVPTPPVTSSGGSSAPFVFTGAPTTSGTPAVSGGVHSAPVAVSGTPGGTLAPPLAPPQKQLYISYDGDKLVWRSYKGHDATNPPAVADAFPINEDDFKALKGGGKNYTRKWDPSDIYNSKSYKTDSSVRVPLDVTGYGDGHVGEYDRENSLRTKKHAKLGTFAVHENDHRPAKAQLGVALHNAQKQHDKALKTAKKNSQPAPSLPAFLSHFSGGSGFASEKEAKDSAEKHGLTIAERGEAHAHQSTTSQGKKLIEADAKDLYRAQFRDNQQALDYALAQKQLTLPHVGAVRHIIKRNRTEKRLDTAPALTPVATTLKDIAAELKAKTLKAQDPANSANYASSRTGIGAIATDGARVFSKIADRDKTKKKNPIVKPADLKRKFDGNYTGHDALHAKDASGKYYLDDKQGNWKKRRADNP